MEATLQRVWDTLNKAEHIVILGGVNVSEEAGLNGVRSEHNVYDIEATYGYCGEEIASAPFLSRRSDVFYHYYKHNILNKSAHIKNILFDSIKILQDTGRVEKIITRMVYPLFQYAGCDDVLMLHGSVDENYCPNCKKIFDSEYVRNSDNIPRCDKCDIMLRPGFVLFGERVDNGLMSKACDVIEKADVVVIVGASMRMPLCSYLLNYFEGSKIIMINNEEKPGDDRADYRLYGNLGNIVSKVVSGVKPLEKKKEKKTKEKTSVTRDIKDIQNKKQIKENKK